MGTSVVEAAMAAQVFEEKKVGLLDINEYKLFYHCGLADHFTADALNF